MLKAVRHTSTWVCALLAVIGAGSTLAGAESELTLTHPQASWSLVLELPGFDVGPPQLNQDETGIRTAAGHEESGLYLTAFIEPVDGVADAPSCREFDWKKLKRGPLRMTGIRRSERGGMAILEYWVREYQGVKIDQRHLNAYLYKDGLCIDLHLSKSSYKTEEKALFEAVLDSVRIEAYSKGELTQQPESGP